MYYEEFKKMKNIEPGHEKVLSIDDLKYKSDRTLLYGYTCDRKTWHVYIKNLKIYIVSYEQEFIRNATDVVYKNVTQMEIVDNTSFIPSKRLYPETCDFEFCCLLKNLGYTLPFTAWNEDRVPLRYYGMVI